MTSTAEKLFWELYQCPIESDVEGILKKHNLTNSPENWRPYGGNENNYGVVENQQASPIPALVEKLTNGIDAILEKRCLEKGINPKSSEAPRSIDEAVEEFFPNHANWDLSINRKKQAEALQILADGPRGETSLTIYDDGVGQAPEKFEDTFLSLLRGNKNEIHFVQGKYNMGGAGAVVFCGKNRYQLVASKRYDGLSNFGFTLVRRHPLSTEEDKTKKSTWYEYLVIDDVIPSFPITDLDLGLHNRKFTTGTVIKLYSYDLPSGSRSVISRDLNQSINEYLFSPALPMFTIDTKERYPDDRNLERDLFGLKRRLEEDKNKYVECYFSEEIDEKELGKIRVNCYVFRPRAEGKNAKETKATIRREFFKNNMSVLFSMNGQIHGNYTAEFITRSLKFPLLKDHILIHVDCSNTRTEVRNELFMASRDRLKDGEESRLLRKTLTSLLGSGRLKESNKARKASLSVGGGDADEMLRNITRNLPIKDDLAKLLNQTFRLDDHRSGKKPKPKNDNTKPHSEIKKPVFNPMRFPSIFNIEEKQANEDGTPMVKLPLGGSRTVKFSTDVEDQYFDRVMDPGDLQIGLLGPSTNSTENDNDPVEPSDIHEILDVIKSSPSEGRIRVCLKPSADVSVGDIIRLKADLSSPDGSLEQIFLVKITDPEKKKKSDDPGDQPDDRLGLPTPVMVYEKQKEEADSSNIRTWEELEAQGIEMNYGVVVKPLADGEGLSDIFINMDSSVLLDYRAKLKTPEAITVAEKRYFSAVYFHTLFLYVITKNQNYLLHKGGINDEADKDVDIPDYISELFSASYAQFLLNFDTQEIVDALEA